MTHEDFIVLWERACKSEHRVQSMYFGGSHGFCSQWKVELWSHGQLGATLTIGNCGIWENGRETWRLNPFVNGEGIGGQFPECQMTNEQSLRCVKAWEDGLGILSMNLKVIKDLL